MLPQTAQHNLFYSNFSLWVSRQQNAHGGAVESQQFDEYNSFDCAVGETVEDQEPLVPKSGISKPFDELDG